MYEYIRFAQLHQGVFETMRFLGSMLYKRPFAKRNQLSKIINFYKKFEHRVTDKQPNNIMLRTFSDGSKLMSISARELTNIPVWNGNRILDETHAKKIQEDLGHNIEQLESTVFRVVQYKESNADNQYVLQKYLIDGQHRAHVIRMHFQETLCAPDFQVLVIEKKVDSPLDAIEYFNTLNNVKAQQWPHDPTLLANKYIAALDKQFNVDKKNPLIRLGKITKRPFLSGDLVREALEKFAPQLKLDNEHIQLFVAKVVKWNEKAVQEIRLKLLQESEKKNTSLIEGVDKRNFALAYNPKLPWVKECLGI